MTTFLYSPNSLRSSQFRRNGKEVDRERVDALTAAMKARRGVALTEDQVGVFERCEKLSGDGGNGGNGGWEALQSLCPDVEMTAKILEGAEKGKRQVATGKVSGVVDCSAEEAAAWVMDYCSRERMRENKEEGRGGVRLELREKKRENERTFVTVKKMPYLLDDREFIFRMVWKSDERGVLIAFEPVDDEVDYGIKRRRTRGTTTGLWRIENLPARFGSRQSRVTLVQRLDAGGIIPSWLVNKKLPESLATVQKVIDEFRQDANVDSAERNELSSFIKGGWKEEVYSEEENALIQRVREKLEGSLEEGKWKQLKVRRIL